MIRPTPRPAQIAPMLLYRPGAKCPGCWRTTWLIGRQSAECAHCGTALALVLQGEAVRYG